MNESHCLYGLSSNTVFSVARQMGVFQIGLKVAVTLISQINKVVAPVDAPGDSFVPAQMAICATFSFNGTGAVEIRFVRRNFPNDIVIQSVDDGELTGTDYVLLTWLLDFVAAPTL